MKIQVPITVAFFTAMLLLVSCFFPIQKVTRSEKTYGDSRKQNQDIIVSYKLPVIKPTGKTTQEQTKGGVTITVEIVPFTATRLEKEQTAVADLYPGITAGYDAIETSNTPYYKVSPENIQFRVRIRNNEQVPLKLSEVGFALIIDGVQWSFPSGYLDDWNKGLILTGFDKEYAIKGPDLSGLYTAQVVYLFLNGVPTQYDEAGNIKKKDNFQWYFECKTEEVQKEEQTTYTYSATPIHKEQCAKCNGTGVDPQAYKCSTCNGTGQYKNVYDGKMYSCSTCKGKGIVYHKCPNCGGLGVISLPKSKEAPGTSTTTWTGWSVNVLTSPPGAKVSVVNTKTKSYFNAGVSNCQVSWLSSNTTSYPIVIEYQGQTVKVLPYDIKGRETPKVEVDFLGGSPVVIKGRVVN